MLVTWWSLMLSLEENFMFKLDVDVGPNATAVLSAANKAIADAVATCKNRHLEWCRVETLSDRGNGTVDENVIMASMD